MSLRHRTDLLATRIGRLPAVMVTAAGAGAFTPGGYEVWTGFFTGSNPNWKNMTVSEAPGDMRDQADRVKITTITLD